MTARSNIKMARAVLSVGALALAAVTFALPVGAMPKPTRFQQCMNECIGDFSPAYYRICAHRCEVFGTGTNRAAISRRHPKPVSVHPRSRRY